MVGGQKSGMVHALDPDTGEVVWQTHVGRGGIQGGVHLRGQAVLSSHSVCQAITNVGEMVLAVFPEDGGRQWGVWKAKSR